MPYALVEAIVTITIVVIALLFIMRRNSRPRVAHPSHVIIPNSAAGSMVNRTNLPFTMTVEPIIDGFDLQLQFALIFNYSLLRILTKKALRPTFSLKAAISSL